MDEANENQKIADAVVEYTAACDRCYKQIRGIRYHCPQCPNWDYCSDCHRNAQSEHPMHQFTPLAELKRIPIIYKPSPMSVTIDLARMSPVEAIRRLGACGPRDDPYEPRIFGYTPLADDNSFRLLALMPQQYEGIICCKIVHVRFDQELEFDALSYAWGNQRKPARIFIEGMPFPVAEPLEQFLQRVQPEKEPLYLWIDAICIDQIDDVEKSTQVQRMGDIYRKARRVIFWLGEAADDSDIVIETIQKGVYEASAARSIAELFERPCWSRVWCLQELTLPKQTPLVMCGGKAVDWKLVEIFFDNLPDWLLDGDRMVGSKEAASYLSTKGNFLNYARTRREYQWKITRMSIQGLVTSLGSLKATDPRDYVYGCVGLSADADAFRIDYTESLPQVFTRTAKFIIESTQELDILCYSSGPNNTELIPSFPSWVPNWANRRGAGSIRGHPSYQATGGSAAKVKFEGEMLKAVGAIYDRVERVSDPINFSGNPDNTIDVIIELEKMLKDHMSIRLKDMPDFSVTDEQHLLTLATHPRITDKFWRTLICNMAIQVEDLSQRINSIAPADYGHRYEVLRYGEDPKHRPIPKDPSSDLLQIPPGVPEDFFPELPQEERIKKYILPFERSLIMLNGRCFFVTVKGDIGIAHPGVKVDDGVSIFLGSNMPLILRLPQGQHAFQFISEAYVAEAMRGQRLVEASEQNELFWITLQ